MKKSNKKGLFHIFSIELIFAILIAVCIVCNTFIYHAVNDYHIDRYDSTLFVPEKYIDHQNEELESLIREYHPDATRMIEIYNIEFDLQSRIIIDENINHKYNNIKDYPKLIEYFNENREGHTYYMNDEDTETDFYFTWYTTYNANGEEQLVLIFISRPKGINTEIHDILSYIILGLSFGIIVSIYIKQSKRNNELMNTYQNMDNSIKL